VQAARSFGAGGDPRGHLNPDGTRPEQEDAERYHDPIPSDHNPISKIITERGRKWTVPEPIPDMAKITGLSQEHLPYFPRTRLQFWGNYKLLMKAEYLFFYIPTIIILGLVIPAFTTIYALEEPVASTMTVKVTGRQWYWVYEVESPTDDGDDDDTPSDSDGTPGSGRRQRDIRGRGGLRSRGVVLLDKAQSRVEKQLFHDDAVEVLILNDVPLMRHIVKIPLPGQAQALTTGRDAKHVLRLNGDMEAVLGERTFKSFKAFSLSDLMEFHQLVEYVAEYQPEEKEAITQSVVKAMRVIVRNAVQVYTSMRDSQWLGEDGEHFRAYTYLQVMCLVMLKFSG